MLVKPSIRQFSSCLQIMRRIAPDELKSKTKSTSSQHWLSRQLSDPYVEKAKLMNYRCRSAFKLIEIDDKFKILHPGHTVVDCGASPGSWTQVAVKRVNSDGMKTDLCKGTVLAIDRQQIYPIEGATIFGNMDFTALESQKKIVGFLNGKKADVIVSDMASNATGVRSLDNENIIKLCYIVLRFAVQTSKKDASLLMKLWQCGETKQLENDIARFYNNVKIVKPNSSRSDSTEIFLLGRNFKGLKNN
ncbi:rRNA methyltransferase 2, mitochondrial [Anoplophora glabripennis]|uniref:rRNA methyltransferase 2, mitochondrial n=1 Tax=Anoplophora glabripennis TaxID=217634 RepID=UPI000875186D|nr:rRNA methyltransferase 2, mitochondrial [Anoplophora glabripennis]